MTHLQNLTSICNGFSQRLSGMEQLSSATVEKPEYIRNRSSKIKAAVRGTPSTHGHAPLGLGLTHAFACQYHL